MPKQSMVYSQEKFRLKENAPVWKQMLQNTSILLGMQDKLECRDCPHS